MHEKHITFFDMMNRKARRFNIFDLKLAQFMGIFAALIIVKLIPDILLLNIWWFVILFVIAAVRPIYIFLRPANRNSG